MAMQYSDVLIVGAGPAGSSLAWALRDSGLEVVLMDKQDFPRDKVCAGWITPAITKALELDLHEYESEHVLQEIRGFQVGKIGGKAVKVDYSGETISFGIRRIEFDDYLLKRSDARVYTGEAVVSLEKGDQSWLVNNRFRTSLLVGAGGYFCPVARKADAYKRNESTSKVVAQEMEIRLTARQIDQCRVEKEYPELYFFNDFSGYGWAFRKGDYLNIGLGRENTHKLSQQVDSFCDFLQEQKKIPGNIYRNFRGHAYSLYKHNDRTLSNDNLMLIGDAAGLAYSQSGEGISPAIESALLAAHVIKNAQGDYRQAYLNEYRHLIEQRFGRRRETNRISRAIPARLKNKVLGSLLSYSLFARHAVINHCFLHQGTASLNYS